jgi:hypothetical protein
MDEVEEQKNHDIELSIHVHTLVMLDEWFS